jgi:hypothetical protein
MQKGPPIFNLSIIGTFLFETVQICPHVIVLHFNIDADFYWLSITWFCMDLFFASSVTRITQKLLKIMFFLLPPVCPAALAVTESMVSNEAS